MNSLKPFIIVLSRNYSTGLGVIRSLGAVGYTVDLIASVKKKGSSIIASSSKYVRNAVEVLSPEIQTDSGEGIMKVLMEYPQKYKEKMILFPADDFTASVIDKNQEELKQYFLMPGIQGTDSQSLLESMNKMVQMEAARNAGFLTPMEWSISLRGDVEIPETMVYPCFVKPIQSVLGHKSEMAVCESAEELEQHLVKLQKNLRDRDVLVQEYLHIDKEYDLSGVCLKDEVLIPGVIEKTRVAQHELGVTMCGKMLPMERLGEVREKLVTLLRRFSYIGMFDLELNLCGDKIYFNEINFRCGGPNFFYYLNGVNLPEILVKELLGEKVDGQKIETFGKTFVYEKVAWEDYIHGYMSKRELQACLQEADFGLLVQKNDPAPGNHFEKRIRLSMVKQRMKKQMTKAAKERQVDVRPQVIVAGRNYGNILSMTRAFGKAGYDVGVLKVFKKKPNRLNLLNGLKPDAYSKYVKDYRECIVNDEMEKVVEALLAMKTDEKTLLVPVDDYVAYVVDQYADKLKEKYELPGIRGKQSAIVQLMDKCEQKRLAADFGVPLLQSVRMQSENGEFQIPEQVEYPCFIKPNVSMKSTKAQMAKCDNREALEQLLCKYAKQGDFDLLIEKYVEIKTEYSVLGISTPEATIAPGVFQVVSGGHRERKGVAVSGKVVHEERMQPVIQKCVEFIASLEYTGLFDVDLLETMDGELYFVELNFRAGASIHAFTESGLNLPGMWADSMLKQRPINSECKLEQVGKTFVSEKVLLEEYVRNDVSLRQMKNYLKCADITFIRDENDTKPYKHFRKYYMIAGVMKLPYWMRDHKKAKNI